MDWKGVKIPKGNRIFRSHKFTYMHGGSNFIIEIDEGLDGASTGHSELSTDSSGIVPSVSGSSVQACLQAVIEKIKEKFG